MNFTIIGGSIYGCYVAWELAKRGAAVTLLEAKEIASGASGGLGKRGVRANGRDLRELPLMRLAYDIWPELHDQIGAPTGYERTGNLLLIEKPKYQIAAPSQVQVQNQFGVGTRWVGPDELYEMEPWLGEGMLGAICCPRDGIADHTATTRGVAQAAAKLGADIREYTAVSRVETNSGRVTAVITQDESVIPVEGTLLLLSNAHTAALLAEQFGTPLPLWPILPQVMLTDVVDPMPVRHLIGHSHRTLAMKANPDGRVMISGGWQGKWNDETKRGETQPDQVAGNLAEAVAVYPCLEGVGVHEATADRYEMISYDNIPIIDRLPQMENALFATGWSGHGWAIAPAVAQQIAEWAWSGEQPTLLRPFRLGRFTA